VLGLNVFPLNDLSITSKLIAVLRRLDLVLDANCPKIAIHCPNDDQQINILAFAGHFDGFNVQSINLYWRWQRQAVLGFALSMVHDVH
jgi:hypothetical protein